MIINYVRVHYANFALIILMNLIHFNNILTSRLLNSLGNIRPNEMTLHVGLRVIIML